MARGGWKVIAVAALAVLALAACGRDDDPPPATATVSGEWERVADPPLSPRSNAVTVWTGHEVLAIGGWTYRCPPGADWFTQRAALSLCGYDVGIEDDDQQRRTCFHAAYDTGEPAEYAYVSYGDEGEQFARWFRVLGPGQYEVFERQTPSRGAPTFEGWVRHTCTTIAFAERRGVTARLPQLDACTAVR
jgi:hypothetical protein